MIIIIVIIIVIIISRGGMQGGMPGMGMTGISPMPGMGCGRASQVSEPTLI